MKNYIKYCLLSLSLIFISGCSEEFLEVDPIANTLESNYYQTEEEMYAALVASYDPIGWLSGDFVTKLTALNAASDDVYAGGGSSTDVPSLQAVSSYNLTAETGPQSSLWNKGYSGIYRVNTLLVKIEGAEVSEAIKSRYVAEAKFLRAFYYFDLIRLFYSIPLITEPVIPDQMFEVEQDTREAVFKQIEEDLLEAIPNLPDQVNVSVEGGRATKGAAISLLGKVYLELEDYTLAAEQFEKVNGTPGATSPFGYSLLENYADLFRTDNEFNSESIFEVSHSALANGVWDCMPCTEGNIINIMAGPRGYNISNTSAGAPSFVSGYGCFVVTEGLVDAFQLGGGQFDPRYSTTISNVDSLQQAGVVTYEPSYKNTGYFLKKFIGRTEDVTSGGGATELNFPQNNYEMRLADIYLLEAEALVRGGINTTRAQQLLDAVRDRVGLDPVPATFENIMNERRLELAGEGHRWFDLVRTGLAATALKDKGYVEGKHDKLPIPLRELTNTSLVQDPAY
ncbi:membrane protein [Marivirga lumbricoides]|uniref:Membrane protein n=1 Tax=Marivirga lumbricoides TaxID=1046115 RepID=A0ABQ1N786_9BACT|nr:membrane protein [Marivirga lumbricoides]